VDAEVRVVIEVGAVWDFASDVRATSAILRDDDGRVRFVRVRIRPEGVVARLLPHEMEHVIEQLEGLDLPRLAAKRDGRVWLVGARSFETRRACAIGTRVEQEYKEYKGPVVSAATPGGAHAAGTW
jgi:hypothetical protein